MNKNILPLNSPITPRSTPIRRLGLSRKRKKYDSEEKVNTKLQACGDDSSSTPISSHLKELSNQNKEEIVKDKLESTSEHIATKDDFDNHEFSEEELKVIKKRIEEKEAKLRLLDKQKNKILELENLIEIWKTGCKNAYLYLLEIIKNKENENFNCKKMLESLGIWNPMVEIFENDTDIDLKENL